MRDPADLTATEAARWLRQGRLRAVELAEACLARVAAREGSLRALARYAAPGMLAAAAAADRRGVSGLLHGLPIGVKDVLDTADFATEYNAAMWHGHRPRADAAAVALARAAGGILLGKTVTTEFASRTPGATTNPWNQQHTPGGSSQGSAAGMAAGYFPLAFGTQTAGSIIRPAAYCGVVGFKPSYGLVHRAGMKVMSESLDTVGFIVRAVSDAALFLQALTGLDMGEPEAMAPRPPRLALCFGPAEAALSEATRAMLEQLAEACRRAGATVTPMRLPPALLAVDAAHPAVMNMETRAALAWEIVACWPQISPGLREKLDWAAAQPVAALLEGRAAFAAGRVAFAGWLEGFDAVLTACAPGEAPAGLGWTGDPVCNAMWTALHGPCVGFPAGFGPGGLPLGAQLVGVAGSDRATLGWARWVQARLG